LRVVAVLLPVLILLGVEGLLRAVGAGHPTAFFLKRTVHGEPGLAENPRFGWSFFPPEIARQPTPFFLPIDKPKGIRRILVLGESAARGDPDPVFGFSRLLELMLRAQDPARSVKLINTGIAAINSHAIVEIAQGLPLVKPDVVIVYMGNNEVVGPYGAGTVFSPFLRHLWQIRLRMAIEELRTVQVLETLLRRWKVAPQAARWEGMAMFVSHRVRADAPSLELVYRHFEANLREIIARSRRAGARVVVCTVATNLRDCAPFASAHRDGLSPADLRRWNELYASGRRLLARRHWTAALADFEQAALLDASFADLQFQRGRCLLALRRTLAAREALREARELDTLRFRADTRINDVIRRVAGTSGEGVQLLDIEKIFEEDSPDGLPGWNFFLEHVHFNFDGNYRVARAVAQSVGRGAGSEVLGWEECASAAGYNTISQSNALKRMLPRLEQPPFVEQSNHAEQVAYLRAFLRSIPDRYAPALRAP
jgi:lysophospholipase L1-like esterase